MATDTKDARMPPAASRYCYCVCTRRDVNTWSEAAVFPKDARSAISISGDWARCGSRGGQLYHYYRKYGTQWDTNKKPPTKHHLKAAYANTANGREAVRTPHQLIATAANFLARSEVNTERACSPTDGSGKTELH
ncbi:hypothetical protein GWK47_048305 [Chionoecetes opilio]|uniref:Uncharacterized protein n=1 Tax=Chionoecetes opilio TaxID=41210 RepID=A0A8J5CTY4_CHIOP|nr:hypothetical protein GWK47_048305 [Chionoecetes opilio]